jgi:hypothetical protein
MSDSHTTATPETTTAAPTAHPPVRETQVEAEVDRSQVAGQRVMRSIGGGSPEAPPDRFADALGQMPGSAQVGMMRQLQRGYGNSYVGAVIQQQGGDSSPTSSETVDVKGQDKFTPSDAVVSLLKNSPKKMHKIRIKFGNLATGEMEIEMKNNEKDGVRYHAKEQPLALSHPLFQGFAAQELAPKLFLSIKDSKIEGSIGIEKKKGVNKLEQVLKDKPELIGLIGFDFSRSPKVCNEIEEGKLKFGVDNISATLGGVFSGKITLLLEDEAVKFESTMKLSANIKGTAAGGELVLIRSPEGVVTGSIDLGVALKNFSGNLKGQWDGKAFAADGSISYQGEKLSGNVNIHVMEKEQADRMKQEQKAQPEGTLGKSSPPATTPSQQEKHNYVVAGEGNLEYQFNDWLHGSAEVIADYDGYITVIGEITPQAQIQLFKPEPFRKDLPEVKARAMYGLPVIADIFIEAGIGLTLWATIEGNLKNIKAPFKYSTDPAQCKNFQLQGTINISAAAGITLHGFVDVGLEILDHEIKVGAGIDGTLGIKGYAEATPIIGYREEETEGHDKKGVFFISGDVEIAAQPFLGLEGKLFVKLDSPFWSPAPDKTWTWPLGDKEWPLGGGFGIGANVDYIFGSGKAPTVSFKEPNFSADKFMGDIVTDRLESKQGGEEQNQGQWKEKNTPQSQPSTGQSAPATGVQSGTPTKTATPVPAIPTSSKKKKNKPPSEFDLSGKPSAETESHLARQEEKKKTAKEDAQQKRLKKGTGKTAQEQADKQGQEQKADPTQKWQRGAAAVEQALAYAEKTGIELDELNKVLKSIRRHKEYGFTELYAKDGEKQWIVLGSMSPAKQITKIKKKDKVVASPVAVGDPVFIMAGGWSLGEVEALVPGNDYKPEANVSLWIKVRFSVGVSYVNVEAANRDFSSGKYRSISPRNNVPPNLQQLLNHPLLHRGPKANSNGYLSTNSFDVSETDREKIQLLGKEYGCHHGGSKRYPDERWVADHQPPSALIKRGILPSQPQLLYPQSKEKSDEQGGVVKNILNKWGLTK